MVSLESLLQTYQSGSVTACWQINIQPVSSAYYTSAAQSESIMLPEIQALLNEYVNVFQVPSGQLPQHAASHCIPLSDEGMLPPKLKQFSMS